MKNQKIKINLKKRILKNIFYGLSLLCLFLFSGFLTSNKAQAQSLELGLYPPLLEVMMKPGKSITQVYKIINSGDVDLILKSKIVAFQAADEFGNIHLLENQPSSLSLDWFSFQNADLELGDQFVLKANSDQQVVLKIKIPEDAPENDYYLTLLFENQLEPLIGPSASQAQIKIGANILLTVSKNGEPFKKADIEEFSLENGLFKIGPYQFIDSFSQPRFLLKIKNLGKTLFKPMGTITVSGWTQQKYILDLLPENIITQSSRQLRCFSTTNNQPLSCAITPSWQTKLLIGNYQAQVNFGLDKTSSEYQGKIQFIALPFNILVVVVFLVIILGFFNRFWKR